LIAPYDGAGNLCGFDDYKDYPKVYLTTLLQPDAKPDVKLGNGLCVKKCPTEENLDAATWWT